MSTLFPLLLAAVGGLVAAAGIMEIILGMARTGHLPSRWQLGKHGAETLAGVGLAMWVLLPTSAGRIAFYVGVLAIIAAVYIGLAERRQGRSPPPMDH